MSEQDKELSKIIELTQLQLNTNAEDVKRRCLEAISHDFCAVCIPPYYIGQAKSHLKENGTKIVSSVAYPLGHNSLIVKSQECIQAIQSGADEINLMLNHGLVKDQKWTDVEKEIALCTEIVQSQQLCIKVICECAVLSRQEIVRICEICVSHKVDFVQVGSGYKETSRPEHIKLLRNLLPNTIGLQASGQLDGYGAARILKEAGASRFALSNAAQLFAFES